MKSHIILMAAACAALAGCARGNGQTWTEAEKELIASSDTPMRVLTIFDQEDSLLLRQQTADFSAEDLRSEEYAKLEKLMIATVKDADGVGIAGPQVGLVRRVVAVQRFDKDGEFEVYPNVRIAATRGELILGGEGCLSVPGWRGKVRRSHDIDITYTSPKSGADTMETVQGFTAVIFQHEADHLDGTIYIDKADTLSTK